MDMVVVEVIGGPKRPDPRGFAKGCDTKDLDEMIRDIRNFSISPSDLLDINVLDLYREFWERMYGRAAGIPFEAETDLPNMHFTDGPRIPEFAGTMPTMQVYSMMVTQISHPLKWPLDIYGVVAVRDFKDHKRNILFRRDRDNFQTLSSLKDSLLELTGPSRAVLLREPRAFEIDVKVKGNGTPSEDKALCYNAFIYYNLADYGNNGHARTVVVPSKHNTMEVRLAHLEDTVEATITISVIEKQDFCALFTAHTTSIDDRIVLLDSRGHKVDVDETGQVKLQRRVLTVEESGGLVIHVRAARDHAAAESGHFVEQQIDFIPRCGLRSEDRFNIGFNKLHVVVAWSLL